MKQYKPVIYRAKGMVNSQSVLNDLSYFLNDQENHGWTALCAQYVGPSGFLIILEKDNSPVYSPEVLEYVNRVQGEGGNITGDLLNGYQKFFKSISPFRDKIGRLNLFATDDFPGFNVPFINSFDGSTIVGNVLDTNNNFTSGDYDLISGLTGNAINKYLQTGYSPTNITEVSQNDVGYFVWISAHPGISATMYDFGCIGNFIVANNDTQLLLEVNSNPTPVFVTPELGFLWVGRQNGTDIEINLNGTNHTVSSASFAEIDWEIFVFCVNNSGTPYGFTNRTMQGYGMTKYLSLTERATLFEAISNFNTSVGRE